YVAGARHAELMPLLETGTDLPKALTTLLDQACTESRDYRLKRPLYQSLVLLLRQLLISVDEIGALIESGVERRFLDQFRPQLETLIGEVGSWLGNLGAAVDEGTDCRAPASSLDAEMRAIEERYDGLRRTGESARYALSDVANFDSFFLGIKEVTVLLSRMNAVVARVAGAPVPPAGAGEPGDAAMAPPGWSVQLDQRRLQHGLKSALAVML